MQRSQNVCPHLGIGKNRTQGRKLIANKWHSCLQPDNMHLRVMGVGEPPEGEAVPLPVRPLLALAAGAPPTRRLSAASPGSDVLRPSGTAGTEEVAAAEGTAAAAASAAAAAAALASARSVSLASRGADGPSSKSPSALLLLLPPAASSSLSSGGADGGGARASKLQFGGEVSYSWKAKPRSSSMDACKLSACCKPCTRWGRWLAGSRHGCAAASPARP